MNLGGSFIIRTKEDDDALIAKASRHRPVLISSAQADELFSISESTLIKLEKEGRIKSKDIYGISKMRRWKYDEVYELWKQNQTI